MVDHIIADLFERSKKANQYPDEIVRYTHDLYERSKTALVAGRRAVMIGDWQPEAKECHRNVERWCQQHEGYRVARGWLYFAYGGLLDFVAFLQHSCVITPEGDLVDITPTIARISQDYPFMMVQESDEEYFEKEKYVDEYGNLFCFK